METISKGVKKVEMKLENYAAQVCQTCKNHANKPSRCTLDGSFVNRKDSCNTSYKWNGQLLQRLVAVKDTTAVEVK